VWTTRVVVGLLDFDLGAGLLEFLGLWRLRRTTQQQSHFRDTDPMELKPDRDPDDADSGYPS